MFQIGSLKEFYLFEHQHVHKRSIFVDEKYYSRLKSDPQVILVIKLIDFNSILILINICARARTHIHTHTRRQVHSLL